MNNSKSKFYVRNIPAVVWEVSSTLGFSQELLPFVYLGVPTLKGKLKLHHLMPIADIIKEKLSKWKNYAGQVYDTKHSFLSFSNI